MTTGICFFGDCRDILRKLKTKDIRPQMCVTSPPYYGLRDYGCEGQLGLEETPEKYIENLIEVFRLVRDLLADDGVLWLNIGDSYYNYRPGKGQALVKQTVSNTKQDLPDTCARRGNKFDGLKEKDLIGIPWMLAFALRADGWYLRQDIIWHKPNPMPESVTDRCTKAHEYVFLLSKSQNYHFDSDAIKEPAVSPRPSGIVRNRKLAYKSKENALRGEGNTNPGGLEESDLEAAPIMRNKRSVWTVNTKPYKGAHFAVFPTALVEPCILAGSRIGDIILDPFFGSGTVGQVAHTHNRQWIGCELNQTYGGLQIERIGQSHKLIC